ncbi:MAG: sugar transferase [Patescibacteria group bacterium]
MKRSDLFFTFLLLPFDYLALTAAGIAAFYARFLPIFVNIRPVIFDLTIERFAPIVMAAALIWILIFAILGLYKVSRRRLWNELIHVIIACSAGIAVVLGLLFFSRGLFESRFIILAVWVLSVAFVSSERLLIRALQRSLLSAGIGVRHVAMIGKNKVADAVVAGLTNKRSLGFVVVAQFAEFNQAARTKLLTLKKKEELDEVILADADVSKNLAADLLFFCDTEQLVFKYSADLFSTATIKTEIHMYAGVPVVEVKKTPLDGWGAIYKGIFDRIFALILILLTLPLQILIVVALFLEQPGRVLFSRLPDKSKTRRVGEGGRLFHYFKFRSMVKDAHNFRFDPAFIKKHGNLRDGTPLFKLKDDPRVTRVGKFLRKFSLDELPEFYLVLLGRMSLVGPRPHLPEEVAKYQPTQRKVLTVKPGITGMGQISGRHDLDFDEEVRLDIYYIENWSPLLDLYILLKTPLVVLKGV